MNELDWFVIIVYIGIIIGLAFYLTRSQRDIQEYYLAGQRIKWWQSGMSTMATQLGAVSFVSAPAFVAIKKGGGLKWLCYELGVPLALIVVMAIIIPHFHRGKFISIYEYLEKRFDSGTRSLVSILFQLGRGLATAVAVLAGGFILSTTLSISTSTAIILVGVITIVYDALGGIRVVILSDVLQMMIIIIGIIICGGIAMYLVGWGPAWTSLSPDRFQILDFKHLGTSPEGEYSFWPMVIGGILLYTSYYGCDQSQVQRELTVRDIDGVRKSLLVNAFGRFPLVLMYCMVGIFVGALFSSPEMLSKIATTLKSDTTTITQTLQNNPDRMLPIFILTFLPHGLIGFIFVAIMAALMSSLDSALNSLSAITIKDFYQKYIKNDGSDRHYLIASKICTLIWGIFCVTAALMLANFGEATRQTTIVLINAVGSLLYGPILAAFIMGMTMPWIGSRAVKTGIITGIGVNIVLWRFTDISWLWWNFSGFVIAVSIASILSFRRIILKERGTPIIQLSTVPETTKINWSLIYKLAVLYFFLIIIVCYLLENIVTL